MTSSTLKLARRALALVRRGWTKSAWARDERGIKVSADSERAVQWCASGAINKAYVLMSKGKGVHPNGSDALKVRQMLEDVVGMHVPHWNDAQDRTKEQVVCGFKKVVEQLEEEARVKS